MKTTITILFTLLFLFVQSQGNLYQQAIQNALNKLGQSTMADDFISAANTFERISTAEPGEWLPLYYAAYAYIVPTFAMEDASQKDQYLDKAQQFLERHLKLPPTNRNCLRCRLFCIRAE